MKIHLFHCYRRLTMTGTFMTASFQFSHFLTPDSLDLFISSFSSLTVFLAFYCSGMLFSPLDNPHSYFLVYVSLQLHLTYKFTLLSQILILMIFLKQRFAVLSRLVLNL